MARAPPSPDVLIRLPGAVLASAGLALAREWRAGTLHRLAIAGPGSAGLAVRPRDLRPPDAAAGARLLAGDFRFGGETLDVGPGGDPWRRALPSQGFATALHGFGWAGDLVSQGEAGVREALRHWLEWRRVFGDFNAFAWTGEPLERRVFNLTCLAPAVLPLASEAEGAAFLDSLARQARHLLNEPGDAGRRAERAVAVAFAGASLAGRAGEALYARAAERLKRFIPESVLRDGVHAGRSPERGLELLFDLLALDDALSQLGAPAPMEVSRAIDRLLAATRFFSLADGRLAAFHGGEAGGRERIAAALTQDREASAPPKTAPYGAFQRLEGRGLQVLVDAGVPPAPEWRRTACAQLGAVEIVCDGQRLVAGSAWSAKATVGGALRGPAGGSCLALGEAWPGAVLRSGLIAGGAFEALEGGAPEVKVERSETADAAWLDLVHEGWRGQGFSCARRLFVDLAAGELRGEDRLTPAGRRRADVAEVAIRFHLAPGVAAQVAADARSVVLRADGRRGWRLRTDSAGLRLEAGVVFEAGEPRVTQVVRLIARATPEDGVRVRWKLSRDEG